MFYHATENNVVSKKIVLAGLKRGAGITHISILLATYFREVQGAKTAIIEWNKQGDFTRLEEIMFGYTKDCFTIHGIDYFRYCDKNKLRDFIYMNYNYIILDLGVEIKNNEELIENCEEKLFIGNLQYWEQEPYIFLSNYYKNYNWTFVNNLGIKEVVKSVQKQLHQPVYTIGYQPIDKPLNKEAKQFFYSLK